MDAKPAQPMRDQLMESASNHNVLKMNLMKKMVTATHVLQEP